MKLQNNGTASDNVLLVLMDLSHGMNLDCILIIPENTTKIRAVLNAGWSSQPNKEATTWFDGINILAFVLPVTETKQ